jgi:hypothetical protein
VRKFTLRTAALLLQLYVFRLRMLVKMKPPGQSCHILVCTAPAVAVAAGGAELLFSLTAVCPDACCQHSCRAFTGCKVLCGQWAGAGEVLLSLRRANRAASFLASV